MVKVMETTGDSNAGFEVVFRGEDDANEEIVNEMQSATSNLDTKIVAGGAYQWSRGMDGDSTVSSVVTPPEEDSPLRETQSDPFKKPRWLREASSLSFIIGGMITFCVVITIALIVQILVGSQQIVPHSGVLSDDVECSKMGLDLLKESSTKRVEDASSTDAAILTSLCLMVKNPHKGGLGGGGFMLIEKQHEDKEHLTEISFREMSPANVNVNLSLSKDQVPDYQSVAVPGYLSGIRKAHELFGIKPLKKLFDKAAQLASDGVTVNEELAEAIAGLQSSDISDDLKILLTKDDNTTFLGSNDVLKQPVLSQTLRTIGADFDSFYAGSLGRSIQSTLQSLGSQITLNDMGSYSPDVKTDVLALKYKHMSVAASGVPSSGPVLLSTLHHMEYNGIPSTVNNMMFHQMIESLKFSYGYQALWGNDSEFNELLSNQTVDDEIKASGVYSLSEYSKGVQPLDLNHGGEQHVTVIGHDRSIVTMATGIGSPFGSKILTAGFLMNNAMLDFSWNGKNPTYDTNELKPSEVNFLAPQKKPASSMFAALVLPSNTKCGLYFGFDTHEWTSAISSTVQVIAEKVAGNDVQSSIDGRRVSQEMIPFRTLAENSTAPDDLVTFLEGLGHNITTVPSLGVCSAIQYLDGKITFHGDKRDEEDAAQIF